MQIDPSIPFQAVRGQTPQASPLELYGKVVSIRDMVQLGQLRQQQAQANLEAAQLEQQERQAEIKRQNELRGVFSSSPDMKSAIPRVMGIDPKTGMLLQTHVTQQAKAATDQQTSDLALASARAARLASIAGTITDEATLRRAIPVAMAEKLLPEDVGTRLLSAPWSPELAAAVQQFRDQALTAHQQIEAKRNAERDKVEIPGIAAETERKQLATTGQAVSGISNQAQYDSWRASLPEAMKRRVPAMFSPSAVATVERLGMTPEQRNAADDRDATRTMTASHQKETERLTARGQNITVRGQNMTDSRSRELATIMRDNKPPTAGEKLTLGFYMRAANAAKNIEALESHIAGMGLTGQGVYAFAPNWAQSNANQKLQQAQREFTEARLRRDSGAAIPESEFANDRMTYFPQPGDKPEVLEQKRVSRLQVLRALRIGAGKAMKEIGEEPGDLTGTGGGAVVTVTTPEGQTFTFGTQAAADAFKAAAGIK